MDPSAYISAFLTCDTLNIGILCHYYSFIMGKKRDIYPTRVSQMVVLKEEGISQRAIANRLGCSQSAVRKCLSRYNATGSFDARKRPARPRITSSQTDRHIHRLATKNPFISASKISMSLPRHIKPSFRRIRRRLKNDFQLKSMRAARKPSLSAKNIKDRQHFGEKYANWTKEMWAKFIFSDEAKLEVFRKTTVRVWRPLRQRNSSKYTIQCVQYLVSLMFWGCISAKGKGDIWIMPKGTTINGEVYLSIFETKAKISNVFKLLHHLSIRQLPVS